MDPIHRGAVFCARQRELRWIGHAVRMDEYRMYQGVRS